MKYSALLFFSGARGRVVIPMFRDSERIEKTVQRPLEIIKSALSFRVLVRKSDDNVLMLVNAFEASTFSFSKTFK